MVLCLLGTMSSSVVSGEEMLGCLDRLNLFDSWKLRRCVGGGLDGFCILWRTKFCYIKISTKTH